MYSLNDYLEIQQLKAEGLNRNQVSDYLEINYGTITRYWDMSQEEFMECFNRVHYPKGRKSRCDKYKREILAALERYPNLTASQIYDRLEAHYGQDLDVSESTVRNCVRKLREEYDIPKERRKRDYLAVRETEIGKQAQVDFGEITVRLARDNSKRKKLFFFCMTLSYSRYKFVYWQERPFTSRNVVEAHEKAFEYFGGRPEEIVYDQDSTIISQERNGEVVYTQEFANYLQIRTFKPYICHKADPESKGKVENTVKYVKYNFARGREFSDIEEWNQDCYAWLDRRANGKEHQTIKKIPAEVFACEQKHLIPVGSSTYIVPTSIIPYKVSKDNTLHFRSNRYELPKGTYNKMQTVGVFIEGGNLVITDKNGKQLIQVHKLCEQKGQLISIPENTRPTISPKAQHLRRELEELFNKSAQIKQFTRKICQEFPRNAFDQFQEMIRVVHLFEANEQIIVPALKMCISAQMESAGTFKKWCYEYARESNIQIDEAESAAQEKTRYEIEREEREQAQHLKEQQYKQYYESYQEMLDSYREPGEIDVNAASRERYERLGLEKFQPIIDPDEDIYADYR